MNEVESSKPKADWLGRWHVSPSLNKDYDVIDGLRGVAILMVVFCHLIYLSPTAGPTAKLLGGVAGAGTWGVTLFFTLSGFLISHPFWRRKVRGSAGVVPPGYGWRRFWKIYPPLALSLVLLVPVYILLSGDLAFLSTAGQWLVGWPLVHPVSGRLNSVMWSLIVEIHFYLLLPLVFLALRRVSSARSVWVIFFGFLLIPTLFRWCYAAHGMEVGLRPTIRIYFPSLLDSFAFGIAIAGAENLGWVRKSWARLGGVGAGLLVVAMVAYSWFLVHPSASRFWQEEALNWLMKLAAAMLLCYIADPSRALARLLCRPWLRWCGIVSYEWYLFHQPMSLWFRDLFGPAAGLFGKYVLIFAATFLGSLLLAAIIYRYFSLPILKFGRGRNAAKG